MADDIVHISPSKLRGTLAVPPSKSHTLRALLFALMAHGQSRILNPLPSPDTTAMIGAISQLGAIVQTDPHSFLITGTGSHLTPSQCPIDCGNSGQILRFLGALSALFPFPTTFTGDFSIRHRRPTQPLLSALEQLGASVTPPFTIQGPLLHRSATLSGEDSQPVSGLLIAASFAPHPIELRVTHPGEIPWIDLTLHWLKRFQIPVEHQDHTVYHLQGKASIPSFTYTVPADWSSAAYPIAAALLTQSELTLTSLDPDDPQGDKALLSLLAEKGARFTLSPSTLQIHKSPSLAGGRIDINPFIDALPILAVLACFATSPTELVNGAIARCKESDRIHAMAQELTKMGARLEERPDGLLIYPSFLRGHPHLDAHSDHRIALALSVAALAATGDSTLYGTQTISKSYPQFFSQLQALGAKIAFAVM